MRTFLLPREARPGEAIKISGKDHHYLIHVLRLREGSRLRGTDGRGNSWQMRAVDVGADFLLLKAEEKIVPPEAGVELTLLQCLPKGRKMDTIVRQATEIGVRRVVPVISEHTVARLEDPEKLGRHLERWRRIAREALQQSGAPRLPEIASPLTLENIAAGGEESLRLFCHQDPLQRDAGLHRLLAPPPARLKLLIGPEGGFSEAECAHLRQQNFRPVWMGDTVLRTETAAVFVLAAVKIIIQENRDWTLNR
jgi:16S rRNA (uracil1498-N3)-methyltransferase